MEPERWRRIEELCHAALEREVGQRAAFLAEACAGDESLRREVESLLAHENTARDFMEAPAVEVAAKAEGKVKSWSRPSNPASSSIVGKTVSHYRIVEKLGGGGMGVVYKAEDTRLRRAVALKFLPENLEQDHLAFERLRREAQSASALNHPNICTVYDIDEFEGRPFIAMELLEGETLRGHIAAKPLKTNEIIELAIQVSDALEAAHSKGIIHRDIKPENVFVLSQSGTVRLKVLDFGIAKQLPARSHAGPGEGDSSVATAKTDASATLTGLVLGTVSYMSPEQARGEKLDSRTDLFSFGAVLYEMATGKQSFPGNTSAVVFDAILNREPAAVSGLNPKISPKLEEIIHKALEKDLKLRYQSASDLRADLLRLKRDTESGRHVSRASGVSRQAIPPPLDRGTDAALVAGIFKRHPRAILLGAAITVIVMVGVGYSLYRLARRKPPGQESAMKITEITHGSNAFNPIISPDGKYVVYEQQKEHQSSLWLYQVATGSNVQIVSPVTASPPTFSNDGNYVYYVNHEKEHPKGVLCKVASLGGEPRKLFENLRSAVTFSPDGKQLAFLRRTEDDKEDQLTIANEDGSAAKVIYAVRAPEQLFNHPAWSPDGKTIAIPRQIPSPFERRLVAVPVDGGEAKLIGSHTWSRIFRSAWLPDGSGLINVASDLNSPDRSQIYAIAYPRGEVRRITLDSYDYNGMGVTADGNSLVTVQNVTHSSTWIGSMVKGQAVEETIQPEGGTDGLDWTSDGRIVYTAPIGTVENLGSMDANGRGHKQLTALEAEGERITEPSVCGDGRHVVAVSNHGGNFGLFRLDADGTNLARLTSGTFDASPSCTPDGKWVIFESKRLESENVTLWKISIDGVQPTQLTTEDTQHPAVSSDGKWIACLYIPDPGKWWEEKFAILPAAGGGFTKIFESKEFGDRVKWTPDGQSLTYPASDGVADNLWNQPVGAGPPRRITNFEAGGIFRFAWSRDGKRLAVVRGSRSNDVVMISNFRGRD